MLFDLGAVRGPFLVSCDFGGRGNSIKNEKIVKMCQGEPKEKPKFASESWNAPWEALGREEKGKVRFK